MNDDPLILWDNSNLGSFDENEINEAVSVNEDIAYNNEKSVDDKAEKDDQTSYVDKCIPNWKQTFAWVCWSPEETVLYCLHCRKLLSKYYPNKIELSNVLYIKNPDVIFSVAKQLRLHQRSSFHTTSIYIYSQASLSSFVNMFNSHVADLKTEEDVLNIAKSIFGYSEIDKNWLVSAIKEIGQFLEITLVESLRKSKFYSVVADQCRGILILRWVNSKGRIVEHVFWSYLSIWDKTPMQFLSSFDIDTQKMSLYVANSLCQQCSRCNNFSIKPAAFPPRPPSTISFAGILWKLEFLKPLESLVKTITKLYKKYPYKFAKTMKVSDFKALPYYEIKPTIILTVMEFFSSIKSKALEIYSKDAVVDALGLAMVNLNCDEQHKKIIIILQEIIDTVKDSALSNKISDEQIVNLNRALGSLKLCSVNACFVSYSDIGRPASPNSKSADNVREFLSYVEKFIDENQKSIYYNGKATMHAFLKFFRLKDFITDGRFDPSKLRPCFKVVYVVYSNYCGLNSEDLYSIQSDVENLYSYLINSNKQMLSSLDIIELFYIKTELQKKYPKAFNLIFYCCTLPFLNSHVPRSLFVSFIIEQKLESSICTRLHPDLKPWILYLHHGLEFITPKELLSWWVSLISTEKCIKSVLATPS